jgi:hypothetical protein
MEFIRNQPSLDQLQTRIGTWVVDTFDRTPEASEIAPEVVDRPVEFAIKMQASPSEACDLWSRMIRHAWIHHSVWGGEVLHLKEVGREYPRGFDTFDLDGGPKAQGEIFLLWPRFMGHKVHLCLFDGLNPKGGIILERPDPEAQAVLDQIEDASIRRILRSIREGGRASPSPWLEALCHEGPLTEPQASDIRSTMYHTDAERLIGMIRMVETGSWERDRIDPDYVREKLKLLEEHRP